MRFRLVSLIATSAGLLACSSSPEMDEALRKDLEAAAPSAIELAPNAPGTKIVSAIESKRPAQPRVAPVRQTRAPTNNPRAEAPDVAQSGRPQADNNEPAATRPTAPAPNNAPRVQQCVGGCKSVGEVIRNAPFPIKP